MTTKDKSQLSIIILTKNEAINIENCLKATTWADDIVIIDSGSTDNTIDLAKKERIDARIFSHPFKDFGDQRNWALDNAGPLNDWVLFMDADEVCTDACATEIQEAITSSLDTVGFYMCSRYFFMNTWIRHCTLYPSWQLRLLKFGKVRYRKEGHGQREVLDGKTAYIREPYEHYGFSKGIDEWKSRHIKYATNEVELILRGQAEHLSLKDAFSGDPISKRRCLKKISARIPFRPYVRFLYTYIFRGGFLDGKAGREFCKLRLWHEKNIVRQIKNVEQDPNEH